MSRSLRPLLPLLLVVALGACQREAAPPAAPAATPAATPPAAAPASVAAGDSLGIPECDDYLAKYAACVRGKVPEAARASLEQSLDQMRTAWKSAAATEAGKASLAAACKQARDSARAMMQQYGCSDF